MPAKKYKLIELEYHTFKTSNETTRLGSNHNGSWNQEQLLKWMIRMQTPAHIDQFS